MVDGQPGNIVVPPETNWQFAAENQEPVDSAPRPTSSSASVSWSASEFIAHEKSAGWYALLMVGTVVLAGLVYLLTRGDVISSVVIVIVAVVFGAFAARKPRELGYVVDNNGVKIGDKFYPYSGFRSFSIVQEEGVESIWFMPLKRFMPPITIYFDPKDGNKITEILANFLPVDNRKLDQVDRLMHRIRF